MCPSLLKSAVKPKCCTTRLKWRKLLNEKIWRHFKFSFTLKPLQTCSSMFNYSTWHIRSKLHCNFVFDHFPGRKSVVIYVSNETAILITQDACRDRNIKYFLYFWLVHTWLIRKSVTFKGEFGALLNDYEFDFNEIEHNSSFTATNILYLAMKWGGYFDRSLHTVSSISCMPKSQAFVVSGDQVDGFWPLELKWHLQLTNQNAWSSSIPFVVIV